MPTPNAPERATARANHLVHLLHRVWSATDRYAVCPSGDFIVEFCKLIDYRVLN